MLNVLLVESDPKHSLLTEIASCGDYDVFKIEHDPLFVSLAKDSSPDAVVINVDIPSEKLIDDLHTLDRQMPLPIILFSNNASNEVIGKAVQAEVSAVIVDGLPLTCRRINSIIQVALARFKHKQATRQALEDARTQLEDRKQVDRAKAILIKTQNFTEDQAYHTIRKLAMDRKITLGEMARNVIAMAELLK